MNKLVQKQVEEDAEFFDTLESTPEFKRMKKLIEKALLDQWNDVLFSGIINTMFNKYKDFIVKGGKKIQIKKTVAKATNEEELDEAILDSLQQDKFLVGEKGMKMKLYLAFLLTLVKTNMKSIGSYYDFRKNMNTFLKTMANKGGQDIVSDIKTPKPIKFRLSNVALKAKITKRVNVLIKDLDKVTRKILVRHLALGIKNGETKTQIIKRLQKTGKQFSKTRAKRIVDTETEAAAEFMRYETARLNGVTTRTWETAGDDRVCFPKDTQVVTDRGERGIQELKIGDKVLTRNGYRKVTATNKRKYSKSMTSITTTKGKLVCTSDHPIWEKGYGWLCAGDFNVGDFVKSKENKYFRVDKVSNFSIKYAYNFPSIFYKKIIFPFISLCIRMPICSICFESNFIFRQKKVNTISSDLSFLDKGNTKFVQTKPEELFKRSFSSKFTVARERAKTPNIFCIRHYSKLFSTLLTSFISRRTITFFRAICLYSYFISKNFFTSFTNNVSHIYPTTGEATNCIPMRNTFINLKRFSTYRAYFSNLFRSSSFFITFRRAVLFISGYSTFVKIKGFITPLTEENLTLFSAFVITFRRTIGIFSSYFLFFFNGFTTLITDILEHATQLRIDLLIVYSRLLGKSIFVYDIQVEEYPEFYANGILVHNCPICAPLDGVTKKMSRNFNSGDFSGKYPPAHAVCRCSVTYDIEGNEASNFVLKRGVFETIDDLFTKAKQLIFYTPIKTTAISVVNPNAVWAGGKTLIGPDRGISKFIEDIKIFRDYKRNLKNILIMKEGKLVVDILREQSILTFGVDKILVDARDKLTDEGFVQLIRSFGVTKKIPSKNIT